MPRVNELSSGKDSFHQPYLLCFRNMRRQFMGLLYDHEFVNTRDPNGGEGWNYILSITFNKPDARQHQSQIIFLHTTLQTIMPSFMLNILWQTFINNLRSLWTKWVFITWAFCVLCQCLLLPFRCWPCPGLLLCVGHIGKFYSHCSTKEISYFCPLLILFPCFIHFFS